MYLCVFQYFLIKFSGWWSSCSWCIYIWEHLIKMPMLFYFIFTVFELLMCSEWQTFNNLNKYINFNFHTQKCASQQQELLFQETRMVLKRKWTPRCLRKTSTQIEWNKKLEKKRKKHTQNWSALALTLQRIFTHINCLLDAWLLILLCTLGVSFQ